MCPTKYVWELQLQVPGNYNFHGNKSVCLFVSVVLAMTSLLDCVCAGLSFLCVCATGQWCQYTVCSRGQWSRVEVWDCVELQQLEQTPKGELRKQLHPHPPTTEQEADTGDDPNGSMLLVDALWGCSLLLCATLLYIITKIILCLFVYVCAALRTGSSGDALTPPTTHITMESPCNWAIVHSLYPPTHMENYRYDRCGRNGQLVSIFTNIGSIKAESGHMSLCMCVLLCVFGDSQEMMAKQSGVHTLTSSSLDTCDDKHWFFFWLTLTPCWVNTHPNSHQCRNIQQPHSASTAQTGQRRQAQQTAPVQGSEQHHIQPRNPTACTSIMV